MNKKEITIQGKPYPVVFNMQTILNFEEMTNGQSFFTANLETMKNRVAILAAAIFSADENTGITVEKIFGNKDYEALNEIILGYNTVMTLAGEFFKVPVPEQDTAPEPVEGEEKAKN